MSTEKDTIDGIVNRLQLRREELLEEKRRFNEQKDSELRGIDELIRRSKDVAAFISEGRLPNVEGILVASPTSNYLNRPKGTLKNATLRYVRSIPEEVFSSRQVVKHLLAEVGGQKKSFDQSTSTTLKRFAKQGLIERISPGMWRKLSKL